jgi:uncharacterized protein (TIRG00374 family)
MDGKPPPVLKKLIRYAVQGTILGVVATAGVFLYTLAPETLEQLHGFSWHYVPVFLALVVCSWISTAARVWVLSRSLGHRLQFRQAIAVTLSTDFAVAASPAGMGGTVAFASLLSRAGIPLSTSTSILAANLAADGLFFCLLTCVAVAVLIRDPAWHQLLSQDGALQLTLLSAALIGSLLLAGLCLWKRRSWERLERLTGATSFGRKHRLPGRIRYLQWTTRRFLRRTWAVTRFLFKYRRSALLANFLLASIQWSCRYGVLPLIVLAFSSTRNPFPLLLIQGFLLTLSLLLVVPGGGGGVEIVTTLVLQLFVPPSSVAVVLVLWRFFTYHLYLLVGGAVFFWTCNRLNRVFPTNVSVTSNTALTVPIQR